MKSLRLWGWSVAAAVLLLLACGCSTVPAMAPLDGGDIIDSGIGPAQADNLERFDAFLAVTSTGGEDAVRIVQRTVEGAPIYIDIMYKDGKYTVIRDMTEDVFAEEKDRTREVAAECKELAFVDRPDDLVVVACGDFQFLIENWEGD